jgi:uncharacterized protein YdaL
MKAFSALALFSLLRFAAGLGPSPWLGFLAPPPASAEAGKCVRIYYDRTADSSYWMGKAYATLLQNLLGHFPAYRQVVSPIELYRAGDLDRCAASFYIGSSFDNAIPPAFYADFVATRSRVAWIGYNIWNLGAAGLGRAFGMKYAGLTTLDYDEPTSKGEPSFFRNVLYKGEVFYKYGKFTKTAPRKFLAPFEMTRLEPMDAPGGGPSEPTKALALAQHDGNGEQIPYIAQNQNHFFVADVPFSYMHEADRYLVFADALFDILGEKPLRDGHLAFLRVEDVHPLVPLPYLYRVAEALRREGVPLNISLIPIFFDPLNEYARDGSPELLPLTKAPAFMQFLREAIEGGANIVWHGTTHQLGNRRNPFSAISGDDFEFWDAKQNRILSEDGPAFALDRLEAGFYDLQRAGIFPKFWLTPHYQASPADYMVFAHCFPWNIGRVIYFNHSAAGEPSPERDGELWFSQANTGAAATLRRQEAFGKLKVAIESEHWSGQIFPYEIYGDVYGQRLLPENLGNSQPTANEFVAQPRSTQEMLADAKRNLVLRDAWGSFFYHPQLLSVESDGGEGRYPGDASELIGLVAGMKKLGYQFIRIDEFADRSQNALRPEPTYVLAKEHSP